VTALLQDQCQLYSLRQCTAVPIRYVIGPSFCWSPQGQSPSTIPSITVFISRSSFILQMCVPEKFQFSPSFSHGLSHPQDYTTCAQSGRGSLEHAHATCHCRTVRTSMILWSKRYHSSTTRCLRWSIPLPFRRRGVYTRGSGGKLPAQNIKEKELKNIRLTHKKSTTYRLCMLAGLKGR